MVYYKNIWGDLQPPHHVPPIVALIPICYPQLYAALCAWWCVCVGTYILICALLTRSDQQQWQDHRRSVVHGRPLLNYILEEVSRLTRLSSNSGWRRRWRWRRKLNIKDSRSAGVNDRLVYTSDKCWTHVHTNWK